ncbi:MAG: tetratricopeptide repeat protein [Saprospiraceae bacterium]|nr:tetratricopeptide repeat protein [Bacteroidia bacterium]NNE13903.1 tetratricopeptide repeat protein [Saprospiraceae bacterium]NNL90803.1 tetratricopeptide repeat protein [Saprospiraceae bacterium]
MAKSRKDKRNEETLIDVVEVKQGAQEYFEKNKTMILGIITAFLLVVGSFLVYKFMIQGPKENAAKAAIYKAEAQFQRDSFALALENPGGGFEGFLDIIENYSGTETANVAKLYAGICYMNVGRFNDAIEYLNAHSAKGTYAPILKHGNLGDAHSELGDFDSALAAYKKATTVGEDELLTPYYLYKLGLLSKRQGDTAGANAAFQKIKDKYPNSEEGTKVDRLLATID